MTPINKNIKTFTDEKEFIIAKLKKEKDENFYSWKSLQAWSRISRW